MYLRQEGRGIGLASKLKACNLQDLGFDTVDANLVLQQPVDSRSYEMATSILIDLGCGDSQSINLLTNNLAKLEALQNPNSYIKVAQRLPMVPSIWAKNVNGEVRNPELEQYLMTKVTRMGHSMTQTSHKAIPLSKYLTKVSHESQEVLAEGVEFEVKE